MVKKDIEINGLEMTITIDDARATDFDVTVAQILLELGIENGGEISCHFDEIAKRIVKKGYCPETGRKLS